jgi:molybdopterin-guanine dinucleotide biosynthesis protein A
MGRSKAGLVLSGETLIGRQCRLLREAGAAETWVSLHPDRPLTVPLPPEVRTVNDADPDAGPLGGIERLLHVIRTEFLLVVAVDLPRLETWFLQELVGRTTPGVGVVPVVKGEVEPLTAVYPQGCLGRLSDRLRHGRRAARGFCQAGLEERWLRAWPVPPEAAVCLLNWNRPEDWPGIGR